MQKPTPPTPRLRHAPTTTTTTTTTTSIEAAADSLAKERWAGSRSEGSRKSQLNRAISTLYAVTGAAPRRLVVEAVTLQHVAACVNLWQSQGLAARTINLRVTLLAALGIDCTKRKVAVRDPLKWWLPPDRLEALLAHLRQSTKPADALLADYVEWTAWTGLRVEESLRLTWGEVRLDIRGGGGSPNVSDGQPVQNRSEMTVPGTKTAGSQATLALSLVPALILQRRRAAAEEDGTYSPSTLVFPITYKHLARAWERARAFLGAKDNPLATLKALRRTAARYLTNKGMPAPILMSYLRHGNIGTTMGYLKLVGGYSTEEQRRWL